MRDSELETTRVRAKERTNMNEADRIIAAVTGHVDTMLKSGLSEVYARLNGLEAGISKREVEHTREMGQVHLSLATTKKDVERNTERIDEVTDTKRWAGRLVIGAVVTAVLGFTVGGGFLAYMLK